MGQAWQEIGHTLAQEFGDIGDVSHVTRIAARLVVAAFLGGILGMDREVRGKAAGMRTHMLVAVGAAVFVMVPEQQGVSRADLTRVIQGIVAGIGFLGAGAIIKAHEGQEIHGLTTAAGIFSTAAIGVACGMGSLSTAVFCTLIAWVILAMLGPVETRLKRRPPPGPLK